MSKPKKQEPQYGLDAMIHNWLAELGEMAKESFLFVVDLIGAFAVGFMMVVSAIAAEVMRTIFGASPKGGGA